MGKIIIVFLALLLGGCAASPDILIYVEKNVYVSTDGEVDITYTSNAEVKSDARLEGTINPDITVDLPVIP